MQQFSATASWSFANHSGSLLDAWRVRARLLAALCNAISEVYLGQEPISPAAKAQVVAGIAKRFTEKGEYISLEGTTAIL